jgi:UDP-3-O-[3-hydroxymyristoyl] glucosamine N-acyltransferase
VFKLLKGIDYAVIILEKSWGERYANKLSEIQASIFLVKNPRLVISRILTLLHPEEDRQEGKIHPTSQIHPEAEIQDHVFIGPYCIIGKCKIGENSKILGFTVIKDDTVIGKNVTVRENCLIGGCGFGFVRNEDNLLERIPHIGRVVLEDNVELFPYVNVDRATLGETRIKEGTKIDHYCHIGHNSFVGENSLITAGSVLCGGSKIGDRTWVGVGSIIKENISVGNDVVLGLGTVVINEIQNGAIAVGIPAKPMKEKS